MCFPLSTRVIHKDTPGPNLGSENLQVTSTGLVFITSGFSFPGNTPEWFAYMKNNSITGRVILFDFQNPKQEAVELKIRSSKDFNISSFSPHGISVLEDVAKGEHLVYIVNHPHPAPDAVEKFKYIPKTKELVHIKSIVGAAMTITNDLAVVAEDTFYITNFMHSTDRFVHIFR